VRKIFFGHGQQLITQTYK